MRNLNGWDDSDAGLSQGWVRCPSGLATLHHWRLSTRSPYQLNGFLDTRRVCYDNYGSFVYDSPNLFCGPSGSIRPGLTRVRAEPRPWTHLTSLMSASVSTPGFNQADGANPTTKASGKCCARSYKLPQLFDHFQSTGRKIRSAGVSGCSHANWALDREVRVCSLQAPDGLRHLGGLLLVPDGRLMVVEPLLERTFGQYQVIFLITVCTDRSTVAV